LLVEEKRNRSKVTPELLLLETKVCFLFGWRREDREQLWRLWLGCSLVQPLFVCFVHRIHDEG